MMVTRHIDSKGCAWKWPHTPFQKPSQYLLPTHIVEVFVWKRPPIPFQEPPQYFLPTSIVKFFLLKRPPTAGYIVRKHVVGVFAFQIGLSMYLAHDHLTLGVSVAHDGNKTHWF